MNSDFIGVTVGAILTLLVLSYLLGDTPLFRIAQAIFVGVAVGYAAVLAINVVLIDQLAWPLLDDAANQWHLIIPLVLGLLLFAKLRATWAPLGNLPIAFLFGIGGALAIGGALQGALVPQIAALMVSLSPTQGMDVVANNALMVFGAVGAFLSFRFIQSPQRVSMRAVDTLARGWGYIGRWFILIAFGAIFAQTAVSRVSILIGRVYYILHDWLPLIH